MKIITNARAPKTAVFRATPGKATSNGEIDCICAFSSCGNEYRKFSTADQDGQARAGFKAAFQTRLLSGRFFIFAPLFWRHNRLKFHLGSFGIADICGLTYLWLLEREVDNG
jgi:hypothetical protein